MRRADADWIPAMVANYLLGGSTITGRLGANLREEKGWTYGVRSGFAASLQPGGWTIDTAVDVEVVDDALREIAIELERFLAGPVPDEELQRAKQALILSLPRAFETPGRVVSRLGTVEAFGLPADYWERYPDAIRAVTAEEVLRVAREHFAPADLVRVVVGGAPS
jgi:zinc protease